MVGLAHTLLLLALLTPPPESTNTKLQFVVEAPAELAAAAHRVESLGGSDVGETLSLLGLGGVRGAIHVVLVPEGAPLASRAPSWVAGYALPPFATIVLFPARVPSYPDRSLEALVSHEVAHLLIARAAGGVRLPRWFDEGLATVAAREWGIEDRARYAMAVIGSGPESTEELDSGFLGDAAAATRSYALSAAFMRYLLQEYGREVAARIIARVSTGESFATAFRAATGDPLAASEAAFFRRNTFWNTWVPFLTSATALWMGITLLALAAIRARRKRDAEMRARFARDEEPTPPTGVTRPDDERLRIN